MLSVDQEVVLEVVSLGDALERETFQRGTVDGRVTVLGVEQVPVPGRGLGEERQHDVAEHAVPRHALEGADCIEAVGLGELRHAVGDRVEEGRQEVRIHLGVASHHHRHVRPELEGSAMPGQDRATDALVLGELDHLEPWLLGRASRLGRLVRARVVDDEHVVDQRRGRGHDRGHEALLVVRGHDDGDPKVSVHGPSSSGNSDPRDRGPDSGAFGHPGPRASRRAKPGIRDHFRCERRSEAPRTHASRALRCAANFPRIAVGRFEAWLSAGWHGGTGRWESAECVVRH